MVIAKPQKIHNAILKSFFIYKLYHLKPMLSKGID